METFSSSGADFSDPADPIVEAASTGDILEEAFVYAYALVLLDLVRAATTNTEVPTSDKAPMNQLFHARTLATPETASLTRPNVDTLYSQAHVDLWLEPYVLVKPASNRFCSIQPFDGYSNTPVMLGTGGVGGSEAASFVLIGPHFQARLRMVSYTYRCRPISSGY